MRKEKKETKKKLDKHTLFVKIVAGLLAGFTIIGACYTLILLLING